MSDNPGGTFSGMPVFEQSTNHKQRIVHFIKNSYNQFMKKLVVLTTLVVVFVCVSFAIIYSNDHRERVQAAQVSTVKSLKTQLKSTQNTQKLHDTVNAAALKSADDQITLLNQQKATLCTQIKTARLAQPLCQ